MTLARIRQKVERGMPLYTDDAQALLDEIDRLTEAGSVKCRLCGQSENDEEARWLEVTDDDGNVYCSDCWQP